MRLTHLAGFLTVLASLAAPSPASGEIEQLPDDLLPRVKPPAEIAHGQKPLRVNVLVLEFDPLIPPELHSPGDPGTQARSLREVAGWNDPRQLAAGYMQDVCDASGGLIQYHVVEWLIVRRFQKKVDGFVYTPETYMACLRGGTVNNPCWHQPDGLDYPHMINEFGLIPRVESHEIDEVWMMGMPYAGYWESAMAGRGAFEVNGQAYADVPCNRRFVIMGFNVERGVAEMLHDLCHRTEATLSRIYGGWQADQLTTNWARFAANAAQSGTAAVGTCHYPPNGERDYDYANPRMVESTAPDWLNYPDLRGLKERLNCEHWRDPYKDARGQPDYHRNYMCWWFKHLAKAPGVNPDGRLNNWWEYVFNFNAYDERGRPISEAGRTETAPAGTAGYRRPL